MKLSRCHYAGQVFPCFKGADRAEELDPGVTPVMAPSRSAIPSFGQSIVYSVAVSVLTTLIVNYIFDRRR